MSETHIVIRELDQRRDTAALRQLDTSFESDRVYQLKRDNHSVRLVLTSANPRITKSLPLDLDEASWTRAWVALAAGGVQGFVGTRAESWHRRLVVSHFYVNRAFRRQGIGRQLLSHALRQSEITDAVVAWIETSNLNYPAIEAYGRLGFSLAGFDETYYHGTPAEGEFAVFLARTLSRQIRPTNP